MMPVYAGVGAGDEREGQGLGVQCEHPMSTCHLVFAPGLLSLPCLLGLLSPLVTLGLAHWIPWNAVGYNIVSQLLPGPSQALALRGQGSELVCAGHGERE